MLLKAESTFLKDGLCLGGNRCLRISSQATTWSLVLFSFQAERDSQGVAATSSVSVIRSGLRRCSALRHGSG